MRNLIWALHTTLAIGVAKDTKKAVHWFRMAAEQGLRMAQFNLGVAYFEGEGVAKDTKEAVRWYRMAAKQGYASGAK